jgi:multiple antibiotic resistance protein
MKEQMMKYFLAFVPIFVAVDALGMVPFYLSLTRNLPALERRRLLRHSVGVAVLVAIAFLWVGKLVFLWLGLTLSDFLIAGGSVLFIISIRDLLMFEKGANVPEAKPGVVPLAVPLMVGPAVLTTSLILLNSFGVWPTLFSILGNLALCYGILYFSPALSRLVGEAGSNTVSKISNLLLAAISVMLVRRGVVEIVLALSQVKSHTS